MQEFKNSTMPLRCGKLHIVPAQTECSTETLRYLYNFMLSTDDLTAAAVLFLRIF